MDLNKDLDPTVTAIEVEVKFEQSRGGFLTRARNAVQPADPDVLLIALADGRPVDYAEPKQRADALEGALHSDGDAKGSGSETVRVSLDRLAKEDNDVDGIAVVAIISGDAGFSRIAATTARIYDVSTGSRSHVGNVRFGIGEKHNCMVVAVLRRTDRGWTLRQGGRKGHSTTWQDAARFAASDWQSIR